ncbi:hypothetical protein [Leptospira interrogans]|uniref:hypothetical protein n=1 Tax=Leptospira interrogans TaxID=173 RepID=UPI0002B8BBE2|nr:hypothetical protein [Leptospira interrogans]EMF71547.1 hypothetical protein LEP1GSC148_4026 [Leptospira interrogans serovar Canicola str. LT1962]EMM91293.1 hypothetical protein LEP1GSC145_0939 [Leptospira interrogans serovar Djasiman str. LT1649]
MTAVKIKLIIIYLIIMNLSCMTMGFYKDSYEYLDRNNIKIQNLNIQYKYKYIRRYGDGTIDLELKYEPNVIPYFAKNDELQVIVEGLFSDNSCKFQKEKTLNITILEEYNKGSNLSLNKLLSVLTLTLIPLSGEYEINVEIVLEKENKTKEFFSKSGRLNVYFSVLFLLGPNLIWSINQEKQKAIKFLIAEIVQSNIKKICPYGLFS